MSSNFRTEFIPGYLSTVVPSHIIKEKERKKEKPTWDMGSHAQSPRVQGVFSAQSSTSCPAFPQCSPLVYNNERTNQPRPSATSCISFLSLRVSRGVGKAKHKHPAHSMLPCISKISQSSQVKSTPIQEEAPADCAWAWAWAFPSNSAATTSPFSFSSSSLSSSIKHHGCSTTA